MTSDADARTTGETDGPAASIGYTLLTLAIVGWSSR